MVSLGLALIVGPRKLCHHPPRLLLFLANQYSFLAVKREDLTVCRNRLISWLV